MPVCAMAELVHISYEEGTARVVEVNEFFERSV